MIDGGKCLGHGLDAVAAEILHQGRELRVRAPFDQSGHISLIPQIVQEALPPIRATHESQSGVVLVWTRIDPVTQAVAAGLFKGRALQNPIFDTQDIPAERIEDFLDPFEQPFPDDTVQ